MRINNVLKILKDHLDGYDDLKGTVKIENIGEKNTVGNPGEIFLTLVKIAEESTLKNGRYSKVNQNFKTVYKNRPIQTNIFVLFSCNHSAYNSALKKLSQVVEFFQGQNVFTHLDGQSGIDTSLDEEENNEKFKLVAELQDLSFEQTNYIWSFLGGKQFPSVLYKVRMIPLEAKEKQNGEGEPILEININSNASY